jgi:hypothetical protein
VATAMIWLYGLIVIWVIVALIVERDPEDTR